MSQKERKDLVEFREFLVQMIASCEGAKDRAADELKREFWLGALIQAQDILTEFDNTVNGETSIKISTRSGIDEA